jgi:hypothetical protein
MRLDVKAFGLACGILWGAAIFLATVWLKLFGFNGEAISLLDHFYFGYTFSYLGAIIGAIWGFVDGFISGAILAWLYNTLSKTPAAG